jgi:hypothetical protein
MEQWENEYGKRSELQAAKTRRKTEIQIKPNTNEENNNHQ